MRYDHTPGPWEYSGLIPASVGSRFGCTTIVGEVGGNSDREIFANAHLISAAPDLLQACGLALTALRKKVSAGDLRSIERAIEHAIEKSLGNY